MDESLKHFHLTDLLNLVPDSVVPIFMTLALSFLIGLEREEHSGKNSYNFGGIRTFPLIGLCGYMAARVSEGGALFLSVGLAVLGSLLWLSYRKKLEVSSTAGMTTEISGLFTFLMGNLVYHGELWVAAALSVLVLLLLELKVGLEALAKKIPAGEIFTFTRFLLIAAVILPIVPNREFTFLHLNPFHTWLIVVAICTLSYLAYIAEKLLGGERSMILAAVIGGIYSSTSTTVVLAKRSRYEPENPLYTGAIVLASGLMYFRLIALLSIFNWDLGLVLIPPFCALGGIFVGLGALLLFLKKTNQTQAPPDLGKRNPLELQSALLFACIFSAMGILTVWTLRYLGDGGIYGLSFLSGLADVDPLVMSLTQSAGSVVDLHVAAQGVLIATASNNIIKGVYCAIWGSAGVRKSAPALLAGLGLASLLVLVLL